MRIGLTYDLREDYRAIGFSEEDVAEFDCEQTIAALESALRALGHNTSRLGNLNSLLKHLVQGDRWDLVFNIAEGMYGFGRESLIPALLEAYQIPYTFSDPLTLSLCLHKGMAKRVVRDLGIHTARFGVIESLEEGSIEGLLLGLDFPLFVKPVAEGTSKGVTEASLVTTPERLKSTVVELLARYKQPVLVEEYLPGREFTVGVLGSGAKAQVLGALEVKTRDAGEKASYSYENKKNWEENVSYLLLEEEETLAAAREMALAVWRGLGCLDAGRVDLREDREGKLSFIEVNPLAGLNPVYSDLPILCSKIALPYEELISGILVSASERYGLR